MKVTFKSIGLILFAAGFAATGCAKKKFNTWSYVKDPAIQAQLKSFVADKETQANAATNETPADLPAFFAAAKEGDWPAANAFFKNFEKHAGQYQHLGATDERLRGTKWQAAMEVWGAMEAFADGDQKYSALYGNDIVGSIPPGSIYFGGTDPGRFIVTAMEKSQASADPFFGLTQNALADGTYLDYLRAMYEDKIYIPTPEDSQKCFDDYSADAQARMQKGQLKPGETASTDPKTGRIQISGQVAVMEINGLIAKVIFDHNTNRQFYVEESFPLDWMYPYLEPYGLIFKLDREPLTTLSDDIVQQDHDFWTKTVSPMIGDWVNDDTSVAEISAFAEKVYLHHDFSSFKGDPAFVQNTYAHRMFSKERSSSAGMYAWRAQHVTDPADKQRMDDAADFAFRQALALCPYLPEAVFRYVKFLTDGKRYSDALLVAETAAKFRSESGMGQIDQLVHQLKRYQQN
jgi:hypothetical protein